MIKNFKIIILTVLFIAISFLVVPMLFGYKFGYYREVTLNFDAITAITQIVATLLSAYLTYLIIKQTERISKAQSHLEELSLRNQTDLQKRQIKIDLFNHRIIVLEGVQRIITYIEIIYKTDSFDEELSDKIADILKIHSGITSADYPDRIDISPIFRSKFIFSGDLLKAIQVVISQYTELNSRLTVMSMDGIKDKWKVETYHLVMDNCKNILSYRSIIEQLGKMELNIADYEK